MCKFTLFLKNVRIYTFLKKCAIFQFLKLAVKTSGQLGQKLGSAKITCAPLEHKLDGVEKYK